MPREPVVNFVLLVKSDGEVFSHYFSCRRRNKTLHADALMFRNGWCLGTDYTVTEVEAE